MQIVRKITLKGVCGKVDIEKLLAAPGKRMELMKVYGVARKASPGESPIGQYVRFSGSFRAVNSVTGETYQSGGLILPAIAQDLLAGALEGDNVEDVNFGFSVAVHYDGDAIAKYVYEVESLLAPAADDPLERLGQALGVAAPALEAPKAEIKPADDPAPKKTGKK